MNKPTPNVDPDPINKNVAAKNVPAKPDPAKFRSAMQEQTGKANSSSFSQVSPMELAQKSMQPGGASLKSVGDTIAQSDEHLTNIQKQLQKNPNLKTKRQHRQLFEKKLQEANHHLEKMNRKMGANATEQRKSLSNRGPLGHFLGYINDGQNMLMAAKYRLEQMGKNTKEINPANLLAVQIQAAQAQQNLEYASILLSKMVETFKQILNIQI